MQRGERCEDDGPEQQPDDKQLEVLGVVDGVVSVCERDHRRDAPNEHAGAPQPKRERRRGHSAQHPRGDLMAESGPDHRPGQRHEELRVEPHQQEQRGDCQEELVLEHVGGERPVIGERVKRRHHSERDHCEPADECDQTTPGDAVADAPASCDQRRVHERRRGQTGGDVGDERPAQRVALQVRVSCRRSGERRWHQHDAQSDQHQARQPFDCWAHAYGSLREPL